MDEKVIQQTTHQECKTKKCNYCGSDIPSEALFCPLCGKKIPKNEKNESLQATETKKCPHCYSDIPIEASYCKYCGQKVDGANSASKSVKLYTGIILIVIAIILFILVCSGAFEDIVGVSVGVLFGFAGLIVGCTLIKK